MGIDEERDVIGFRGYYTVTKDGRVFSSKYGKRRELKPTTSESGYHYVSICRQGSNRKVFVHRIVAEAFIGRIKGKEINHLNFVRNDNRVENLEICTKSRNLRHASASLRMGNRPCVAISKDGQGKLFTKITELIKTLRLPKGTVHRNVNTGKFVGDWMVFDVSPVTLTSYSKDELEKLPKETP